MTEQDIVDGAFLIDPGRSNVILLVGTKGSGKSAAAGKLFERWPYDRVVIDVTGDARPDDPLTQTFVAPFPSQLPEPDENAGERRVTAWARIDPRSPTFTADQDAALGLGLYPRHRVTMIWVDEYGQAATANNIAPNMRLALNSSRHFYLTLLLACPRPRHIPVLTISQADKVFIFRLPNPADREVVAKNAGIDLPKFERIYFETQRRHKHAFMLWDPHERALISCPPLPDVKAQGPRA